MTISGRGYRPAVIELKRARTPLFIAIGTPTLKNRRWFAGPARYAAHHCAAAHSRHRLGLDTHGDHVCARIDRIHRSSRPESEVLAVQILSFADDDLWGKLSALGIIMILISTTLVMLAMLAGGKFKSRETT